MEKKKFPENDKDRYEELVKIAEAQLDYEKKELLENGGNEDDYLFTYRICPDNEECPFCLYIIGLDEFKEKSAEELKFQLEELREELDDLQSELDDLENGWDETSFDTEEEYRERYYEFEDEIFSLETEISLCNRFIEEKDK